MEHFWSLCNTFIPFAKQPNKVCEYEVPLILNWLRNSEMIQSVIKNQISNSYNETYKTPCKSFFCEVFIDTHTHAQC